MDTSKTNESQVVQPKDATVAPVSKENESPKLEEKINLDNLNNNNNVVVKEQTPATKTNNESILNPPSDTNNQTATSLITTATVLVDPVQQKIIMDKTFKVAPKTSKDDETDEISKCKNNTLMKQISKDIFQIIDVPVPKSPVKDSKEEPIPANAIATTTTKEEPSTPKEEAGKDQPIEVSQVKESNLPKETPRQEEISKAVASLKEMLNDVSTSLNKQPAEAAKSSESPQKAVPQNPQMSDKIESISSEVSLGFGEVLSDLEDRSQTLVIREGPEPYKSILRVVCAYAIRCSHGRTPIQKLRDHSGYWLPHAYVAENSKYSDTVDVLYEFFVNELKSDEPAEPSSSSKRLGDTSQSVQSVDKKAKKDGVQFLSNLQLYNIYRFQIPDGQYISRYIFLAQWTTPFEDKNCSVKIECCKDTPNIQWHTMDSILQEAKQSSNRQVIDRLWGYEVITCAASLQQQHIGKAFSFKSPQIREFTSNDILKYINRNPSTQTVPKSSSTNLFSILLHDAKFTERDVIKIYCDFAQHCYPSMNMTYCSFYEYFTKIGFLQFDDATLRHIFRAMNYKSKNFILFNEFLFGLAALDSSAPNSQLRCTYIFRYYDRNSDGFLDEEDFRRMIGDIREKGNLSSDPNELNNDVKTKLSTLKLLDDKKRICYDAFLREALSGHLSGTVHLFRTNKPILEAIHTRHAYEFISNKSGKPFSARLLGTCPKCRPKKYSLAYNTVKLNGQGRIDDPKALVSLSCGEIDAELQFKKKANEMELKHSIEIVFNENSIANKTLAIIRKMQDFNKLTRERQKEVSQQVIASLTIDTIVELCKQVTEVLLIEPRVLKVNTPCIVMGDLHGNINDLLTYEEQLWPLAPAANAPNVLFLGDYVDRGDYSIEVISYLFSMKILAPTKFFLLRGNHEIRAIQKNFTFAKECMQKYSYQHGQRVFEAFNNAFDQLPLVGIIDESIYCAHGGIPYSVAKIDELYKIPAPLMDPEYQSKAAWEILWSDPITDEEYKQVCEFKNQSSENGFTDNLRRSTAYYFTEKALRNFLVSNNLSHVIRAHELELEGYRFHHSGLLITVFSSSRYCNSQNKSAAVFVDGRESDGFIKVISLDT